MSAYTATPDAAMPDAPRLNEHSLISAERVQGTNVYNTAGEHLGSVDDIMIDKVSGRAAYAVMSFGGFLGIGERYHPLPWSTLRYDTDKGGYVVDLDRRMLEGAPSYDESGTQRWTPEYGRTIDQYYGSPILW